MLEQKVDTRVCGLLGRVWDLGRCLAAGATLLVIVYCVWFWKSQQPVLHILDDFLSDARPLPEAVEPQQGVSEEDIGYEDRSKGHLLLTIQCMLFILLPMYVNMLCAMGGEESAQALVNPTLKCNIDDSTTQAISLLITQLRAPKPACETFSKTSKKNRRRKDSLGSLSTYCDTNADDTTKALDRHLSKGEADSVGQMPASSKAMPMGLDVSAETDYARSVCAVVVMMNRKA
jgi:hypothetical protein